MKRTIENCSLIKREGSTPEVQNGRCLGFSSDTDEPCEICKKCKLNNWYDETEDEI